MKNLLVRFSEDQSGATAIEYGLIATGISIVIFSATGLIGTRLDTIFTSIANSLTTAP